MRYAKLLALVIICIVSIAFSSSADSPQNVELPIPISLPRPPYPPIAVANKITGAVLVDVKVNAAEGNVIEANPIDGPEILRSVAQKAALKARFKPFTVSGPTYTVRLTYIFHEESYVEPAKKPDFKSPYQIEIITLL